MAGPIYEYLDDETGGSTEILATIEPDGTRFGELNEKVGISRQTLSNRLMQGQELGLLDTEAIRGERGTTHKWVLTPKGARLRFQLIKMGAVETYDLLQDFRQRAETHEAEFKEWAEEMEEDGEFDELSKNTAVYNAWKYGQSIFESSSDQEE